MRAGRRDLQVKRRKEQSAMLDLVPQALIWVVATERVEHRVGVEMRHDGLKYAARELTMVVGVARAQVLDDASSCFDEAVLSDDDRTAVSHKALGDGRAFLLELHDRDDRLELA